MPYSTRNAKRTKYTRKRVTKGRRARKTRKKSMSMVRKVSNLAKQVRAVKRLAAADTGTFMFRRRATQRIASLVNAKSFQILNGLTLAILDTAIQNLRYYDPANPAVLVTAAGVTGTFQKEFYFQSIRQKVTWRNNYRVPVWLTAYSVVPKADTVITPSIAYQNGLADVGNPPSTSPLVKYEDSPQARDLWRIVQRKKKHLQAGQECVMYHNTPPFLYDTSVAASQTQTYQPRWKSQVWIYFIEGPVGHDSVVATEQGTLEAALDVQHDTKFVVQYPAGIDLDFILSLDESNAFTNVGIINNKPVAAGQVFSIAAGM